MTTPLPFCQAVGCRNRVKRADCDFCSRACTRERLAARMRALRALEQPDALKRKMEAARRAGIPRWQARMFRADVARLPQRVTREDLYWLCARVYARGRESERKAEKRIA
jgi:hypothetical protein